MEPIERIDRYLSQELSAEETQQFEEELARNPALQRLLASLNVSRRAVALAGIQADVRRAHTEFMAQHRPAAAGVSPERPAVVRPLGGASVWRVGWRVAASVALLLVGFAGYQAATFDGEALLADQLVTYQLPTTRGTEQTPSLLEARYRAGDYAGVVRQADTLRRKTTPDLFLEAVSHLQLRQYRQAIARLEEAQRQNQAFVNPLFAPEIEYYLAMALLGDDQHDRATTLLRQIQQNPRHPYHGFVSDYDLWRLRMADWLD